jgi:hypothetical protein
MEETKFVQVEETYVFVQILKKKRQSVRDVRTIVVLFALLYTVKSLGNDVELGFQISKFRLPVYAF